MSSDLEKAEKDLEKARRDLEKAAKEVANAEKEIEAVRQQRGEIEVSISTTAGFYPAEGFNVVPEKQAIEHELHKAQRALNIKDVTGWIATVVSAGGKRTLDTTKSYAENGLSKRVEIDWGPSEGGGG